MLHLFFWKFSMSPPTPGLLLNVLEQGTVLVIQSLQAQWTLSFTECGPVPGTGEHGTVMIGRSRVSALTVLCPERCQIDRNSGCP